MNRAERRIVAAVNAKVTAKLGRVVHHRDAAAAELDRVAAMVAEDVAAGRSTAWAEPRLSMYRAKLAEADVAIEVLRGEVAMREAAVTADSLSTIIDAHLSEIGLDAITY